jgi:hypothetical protein
VRVTEAVGPPVGAMARRDVGSNGLREELEMGQSRASRPMRQVFFFLLFSIFVSLSFPIQISYKFKFKCFVANFYPRITLYHDKFYFGDIFTYIIYVFISPNICLFLSSKF